MPASAQGGEIARKRRERERRHQSALAMLLMRDPEYAALYNDTMDKLRAAEAATEAALGKASDDITQTNDELDALLAQANVLPNGTRAFRAADGKVYAEDGRLIDGDDLASIHWHDGAPSYEDYLARKKAADDARAGYDAILRYQTDVLGHARDRLTDVDDPPSKDELSRIQRDIEERKPAAVAAFVPAPAPDTTSTHMRSAEVDLPKL